jgi:hypothetical protein
VSLNSNPATDTYLDTAQQILATNNLYKSLLLNNPTLQNLQNLQQMQAACNTAGFPLPGLQPVLPNMTPAISHTATFSNLPLSGLTGSSSASLPSSALATISALQARGLLPAGGTGSDAATLAAALQLRLQADASSASAERSCAGLGGAGTDRMLGGAHQDQSGGGGSGTLQLPPMSLHGGASASEDSRAHRPMGHGQDTVASGENQAPLLAALAASIRANQDKEAQSGVAHNGACNFGRRKDASSVARLVHGIYPMMLLSCSRYGLLLLNAQCALKRKG